jgi:outer membrane protein with beta-barrel domain
MKFGLVLSAVSGVALCASTAAAQVCQGDLSFRNSSTHLGAALAVSNNATSIGGGATFGHRQGLYAGASVGMSSYSNVSGNGIALGGGLGYAMPLQQRSKWQICPGGTLSLGFGPSQTVGAGTMHFSSQTLSMGASVGTALALNKTVNLLPFGSAAFGYTRATAKLNGNSSTATDSYLLIGMGAGFQFTPSLVLRPALSLAAGADLIDDTVFGLSVTVALPH